MIIQPRVERAQVNLRHVWGMQILSFRAQPGAEPLNPFPFRETPNGKDRKTCPRRSGQAVSPFDMTTKNVRVGNTCARLCPGREYYFASVILVPSGTWNSFGSKGKL